MMCARSPPLATDVLTGQYASGNISDGGPSLLGAILHRLPAGEPLNSSPHLNYLLVLVGLLIAIQPAAVPAGAGVVAIVWVWQSVIARVRYRRDVR